MSNETKENMKRRIKLIIFNDSVPLILLKLPKPDGLVFGLFIYTMISIIMDE